MFQKVSEGPETKPEGPGMVENGPGGPGRFQKVSEVSGQYHRCPNTLRLGEKGTPRGLAKILRGRKPLAVLDSGSPHELE